MATVRAAVRNWMTTSVGVSAFVLVGFMIYQKVETNNILLIMTGMVTLIGALACDGKDKHVD